MPLAVKQVRPAMGSDCEVLLFGDEAEHLNSVADAVFAEIARVEQSLSRFEPTSELRRIEHEAAEGGCLVDFEWRWILEDCRKWWQRTSGAFDITAGSRDEEDQPLTFAAMKWDAATRRIAFRSPAVRLDLGAYGKGYGLDCAARLIRAQGITSALLHLGTSSVLAIGSPPDATAWRIDLRGTDGSFGPAPQVMLSNAALSSSATWHSPSAATRPSDVMDPRTGEALTTHAACTVVAPTAAAAEALSTAFTVLGRSTSEQLLQDWNDPALSVIWPQ